MRKKICSIIPTLFTLVLATILLFLYITPSKAYAANCMGYNTSLQGELPVTVTSVSGGNVTLDIKWTSATSNMQNQIGAFYIGYIDSQGNVTTPHIDTPQDNASNGGAGEAQDQTREFTVTTAGTYTVYVGPAANDPAHHLTIKPGDVCNFSNGPTITITTTGEGSKVCLEPDALCDVDQDKNNPTDCTKHCPNGTFCGSPAVGLTQTYCLSTNPQTGDRCDPANSGGKCPGNDGCFQSNSDVTLYTCQQTTFDLPSPSPQPCKPVESGSSIEYNCDTAVGNILTSPKDFVQTIMGLILSVVGGVAILLIMLSGYRLMVSQGNPENIKSAKEQLTAAIIGLLFIIFSLVILQVIGVNILGLPGFN
jgi:hypothetical protein